MATNNNKTNKKPKVNIDGPRLAGTNDLPNDKLLYDSAIEADKVFFNTMQYLSSL